jgi:flagellar biosynthesis GTPase FlhF
MDIEPNPHERSSQIDDTSHVQGFVAEEQQLRNSCEKSSPVFGTKGKIIEEPIIASQPMDDKLDEICEMNSQITNRLETIKHVKQSVNTGLANIEKLEQIDDYPLRESILNHLNGDLSRKLIVIEPELDSDTQLLTSRLSPPKAHSETTGQPIISEPKEEQNQAEFSPDNQICQNQSEIKVRYSKPKLRLAKIVEEAPPINDNVSSFHSQNFHRLYEQRNYLEKIHKYMENLFEGNIDLMNEFENEAVVLQQNISRYIGDIANLSNFKKPSTDDQSTYQKLETRICGDGDLTLKMRNKADRREAELREIQQKYQNECQGLQDDLEELEKLEQKVKQANQAILNDQSEIENLEESIRAIENEIQGYHTSLIQYSTDRRTWSNEYQNLKGSIRVYVRVKPMTNGLSSPIHCTSDRALRLTVPKNMLKSDNQTKEYTYEFEKIYNHKTTQEQMFTELEPLMTSVIDGYNVCILAYGPTGSGKTFTIMGNGMPEFKGLAPRALEVLFRLLKERMDNDEIDYQTKVSLIEVHMDNVKNLLEDTKIDLIKGKKLRFVSKSRENLDEERNDSFQMDFFNTNSMDSSPPFEKTESFNSLQNPMESQHNLIAPTQLFSNMNPKLHSSPVNSKSKIFTKQTNKEFSKETAQEKIIVTFEEACAVLERGLKNRVVAFTAANDESSRSHLIFKFEIETQHSQTGEIRKGSLVLVDLAGSERLNTSKTEGERLEETKAINKSLTALGDVVNALYNKMPHIPFRNSKLTSLLQDCLSGDAKALMIINVSSDESEFQQTLSSLKFAEKVRNCPKLEKKANPMSLAQKK